MKTCWNCEEQVTFTVAAIDVDTELCAPCFDEIAETCEGCGRQGAEDDVVWPHEEADGPICTACERAWIEEAHRLEDEAMKAWAAEEARHAQCLRDMEAEQRELASSYDWRADLYPDYDFEADDLAFDARRETR